MLPRYIILNYVCNGNFCKAQARTTTQQNPLLQNFWLCETKQIRLKFVITPILHKKHWHKKFSETQTQRVPLRIFLLLWDNIIDEKTETPGKKHFSIPEVFRYTKKTLLQKFYWDQKFSTFFCGTPVFGSSKFFGTRGVGSSRYFQKENRYFPKYKNGLLARFSVLWEKSFCYLLVIHSNALPKFLHRTDEQSLP